MWTPLSIINTLQGCAQMYGLVCLILLITVSPTFALDPSRKITEYNIDIWRESDGLPVSTIRAVIQTKDGYLWLGSKLGLVRFDGVRFTLFSDKTDSLKDNEIWALKEDKDGGLWIGTYGGGVTSYKDGKFTTYTDKDGLPNNYVVTLEVDIEGSVWVGTEGGLARFKDGSMSTYSNSTILTKGIRALYSTSSGSLLIAASKGGTYQFKDGNLSPFRPDLGFDKKEVKAICEDHEGALWFSIGSIGVERLKDGHLTHYTQEDGLYGGIVRTIYVDRNGTVWTGSRQGLNRFENGRFARYFTSKEDMLGIDNVYSICNDHEGSLWITSEGIDLARFRDGNFKSYSIKEGLISNGVLSVFEDSKGRVWMGTQNGLSEYKGGKFFTYNTNDNKYTSLTGSIVEDKNGQLWVGTNNSLYQLHNGMLVRDRTNIINGEIRVLYKDNEDSIWIGMDREGLVRIKDGIATTYTTEDGLVGNYIRSIYQDQEGNMWIGTWSGVSRFKDGKFANYTVKDGLAHNQASDIYVDKDNIIWIATRGGLNRFKDGKFTSYTIKDGLFANFISRILEDNNGYFWFSSGEGVFKISRQELNDFAEGRTTLITSIAYGIKDGMKTATCSSGFQPSSWKTKDGKLWFGTFKGAVVVDPNRLKTNNQAPFIHIEEVIVDGKQIEQSQYSQIRPGSESIQIHYTGLSFLAPDRVKFKYKLEGFDEDWVDAGTRRVVYYTNLPPGNYTFWVKACNNDGIWNEHPASIRFTLLPLFTQTKLFYALCCLIFIALIYLLYRLRTRQLRKAHAIALEKSRLKSAFLSTISHELRTPLNGVIGMSNILLDSTLSPDQAECVQTIQNSSSSLLNIINDILDYTRLEAGKVQPHLNSFNLRETIDEISSILSTSAQSKDLLFVTLVNSDVPNLLYGDNGRLKQLLTNLIANAIKFTEQGEVTLRVSKINETSSDTTIKCEISDTGIGISKENQQKLFQAFTQIDASTSRKYDGTGLGLAICKQLIDAMDGEIGVESKEGEGSTFWFITKYQKQSNADVVSQCRPSLSELKVLIQCESGTLKEVVQQYCMEWGVDEESIDDNEDIEEIFNRAENNSKVLILEKSKGSDRWRDVIEEVRSKCKIEDIKVLLLSSSKDDRIDQEQSSGLKIVETLHVPISEERLYKCLHSIKYGMDKEVAPALYKNQEIDKDEEVRCEIKIEQSRVKILLAEDNVVNQKVAIKMLQKLGYRADVVENGRAAVEAIERNDYDIVLMDCMMPEMDGYEATQEIRRREGDRRHTKIIAMTANALVGDRERCLEAGMDDYLSKPVKSEDLNRMIEHWSRIDEVVEI
jgi:signal transduction histidine kinase/ligand-binding sensor domain-containing protein/CheY-like chemotaxis protein